MEAHVKPRLLLIADVRGWIFDRHCSTLKQHLKDEFRIDIIYQDETFDPSHYDLIYPLEWHLVKPDWITEPNKFLTGIRSHLFWTNWEFPCFVDFLKSKFQEVHVVSKRLHQIFSPYLPVKLLSHGVDTEFFQFSGVTNQSSDSIRVGWCGNRMSSGKGFEEFVAPLANLPGVTVEYCGYIDRNLPMTEMRKFYNSIDVYVCASREEGNNNSLMEAASMRRAIVTTDNGTVPEYLRDGSSALIVSREFSTIARAIELLRGDPGLRVRLGNAARKSVRTLFDWRDRAEDYRAFFRNALAVTSSHFHPSADSN